MFPYCARSEFRSVMLVLKVLDFLLKQYHPMLFWVVNVSDLKFLSLMI